MIFQGNYSEIMVNILGNCTRSDPIRFYGSLYFSLDVHENAESNFILSGSFFGVLNYTPASFENAYFFSSLSPGNYTIVAMVVDAEMSVSTDASLEVLPYS